MAKNPDPFGYEQDLAEGVHATGILGAVRQQIAEQKDTIISRLIALYRSHSTDHDTLVGAIAELKALDDFVHNCEAAQIRGNVARERIHNA